MDDAKKEPHPHIKVNADGSLTISFADIPVMDGGAEIKSIHMREVRVTDHLSLDHITSVAKREVALFTLLTELSEDTITGCTMRQYGRLQEAYQSFVT